MLQRSSSFFVLFLLAASYNPVQSANVTFSEDIAAIVYEHCSQCHRPGQSAPFSLLSYEDVKKNASTIQEVINRRYMPPWKPVETGVEFANARKLSDSQLEKMNAWIAADCPEGDPTKAPRPPQYNEVWSLGKPDLILKMDKSFRVPADGPDLYRSFVLPTNLPEDKWVKAMELRPQARGAVHHALFFLDESGSARSQNDQDGQSGIRGMNFLRGRGADVLQDGPDRFARGLGGYVPGATPNKLPGDLAKLLPKGSDIIMQTHFHPTGKVEHEQAELALYFSDRQPTHKLVPIQLPPMFGMGAGLDVPAGEANFVLKDEFVIPIDVQGIEVGGHAHYICREMKLTATLPDQTTLTLLQIDDWDLDWQDQYQFARALDLPKGTKLAAQIVYDNSVQNPENPNSPPKRITWGRESTDEMGSITLQVIAKEESEREILEHQVRDKTRDALRSRFKSQVGGLAGIVSGRLARGQLMKTLDHNQDGKLQANEIPERFRDRVLELLDQNGDQEIADKELEQGRRLIDRLQERKE